MTDLTNHTINQYRILSEIGRGGMATVYRARQTTIDRDVAIKVLPAQFTHDPTFLARFEREAAIAARVQHPRILPVFDVGEYEGMPYIVMAYLPAGTLEDRIARTEGQGLPLDEVVRITSQIAEGLDALHSQGIVHRDLKPSNILFDESGDLFLADFGIAQVQEATAHLTGTGMLGTPAYLAPEVFQQGQATPASDEYALGLLVYEMLAGRSPFEAETPAQWMRAHIEKPAPNVMRLRSDVPPDVNAVLQFALAKDSAQRYPSAGEFASALRDTARSRPRRRKTKRQPAWMWAVMGAILLALFILVGIGVALLLNNRPDRAAATTPGISTDAPPATPGSTVSETVSAPPDGDSPAVVSPSGAETAAPIPAIGGGTGLLGFNDVNGLGYTIDAGCVRVGGAGCDPNPHILPQFGDVTPSFGVWSPDGSRLAFLHLVEGGYTDSHYQVIRAPYYIADFSQNRLTEVASSGVIMGPGRDQGAYLPAWSSDGSQLAVVIGPPEPASTGLPGFSTTYSWVWNADVECLESGGGGDCLSPITETGLHDDSPRWSEDGSRLFFQRTGAYSRSEHNQMNRLLIYDLGIRTVVDEVAMGAVTDSYQPMPGTTQAIYVFGNWSDVSEVRLFDETTHQGKTLLSTTSFGALQSAELSPDGQTLVLSLIAGGPDTELYLLDLACIESNTCSSALIQVTDNDQQDGRPSWSPDGSYVAFLRAPSSTDRAPGGAIRGDNAGRVPDADIYLLDVSGALAGQGEAAVTRLTTQGFVQWQRGSPAPQWQPGTPPASADQPTPAPPAVIPIIGGGTGLLGFNWNGLGYTVDASCVLAGAAGCNADPHILPEIGGITPVFGSWSPDGRITFTLDLWAEDTQPTVLNDRLYVVDYASNHAIQIEAERNSHNPVWSPDESRLAYLSDGDIYITDLNCAGQETLCIVSGERIFDYDAALRQHDGLILDWLPDDRLLIASPEVRGSSIIGGPYMIRPDGSDLKLYTSVVGQNVGGTNYVLTWEGDIVRAHDQENNTSWPLLKTSPRFIGYDTRNLAAFSPDGRVLAYVYQADEKAQGELMLVDLSACIDAGFMGCDGQAIQITDNAVAETFLNFSPDGRWLAFVRGERLETREEIQCFNRYDPQSGAPLDQVCETVSVVVNVDGDLYVLDVDAALNGAGDEAITRVTYLRFATFGGLSGIFQKFNPQWQPAPGN